MTEQPNVETQAWRELDEFRGFNPKFDAALDALTAQIEAMGRERSDLLAQWTDYKATTEDVIEAAERDIASSQQAALLLHKRVEELETALAAAIAEVEGWGPQSTSSTRLREHLGTVLAAPPLARDPEWASQQC